MKILIMTDMEGCAGILNHDDWVTPTGRHYAKGIRLLTEETNAAVRGLTDGGATEIVVVDGHGYGGIDPELLDERAQLLRGAPSPPWPWGLDNSFHGVAVVGQHAKAGTPYSHITHTGWFDHIDMAVNGISIGEYGELAFCAMELGLPMILACGEEALAREAAALTPGVVTVPVKRGLLPDGLDHLDTDAYRNAKLSAVHLAPARARRLIAEGAKTAARRLAADSHSFRYPQLSPPYTRTARLRKNGDTPAHTARDTHPGSLIALANMPYTRVT
ncbi:MAG: M55 family metallopeptidase [Lentisphaerae bacterium]|nr:M55 family metallopeptidase [Lentisphaerota bacterium]